MEIDLAFGFDVALLVEEDGRKEIVGEGIGVLVGKGVGRVCREVSSWSNLGSFLPIFIPRSKKAREVRIIMNIVVPLAMRQSSLLDSLCLVCFLHILSSLSCRSPFQYYSYTAHGAL